MYAKKDFLFDRNCHFNSVHQITDCSCFSHLIDGHWQLRMTGLDLAHDVQVRQARLHHQQVGALLHVPIKKVIGLIQLKSCHARTPTPAVLQALTSDIHSVHTNYYYYVGDQF